MRGLRARSALEGTQFSSIEWVEETGSTNADLMEAARRGAPHGSVLVADHQRSGRGRMGRSWESAPAQALLASVLIRPPLAPSAAHRVATALGVAAAEACIALAGSGVGLKWPNDLVVSAGPARGKLGGLLAESLVVGDRLEAVVVGIGLNVAWPLDLPEELGPIATSLNRLDPPRALTLTDVLVGILQRFEGSCALAIDDRGWVQLQARYRELCTTLGERVVVEVPEASFEGVATGVTDGGHLMVETDDGRRREVVIGDVVHVRPA